MSNLIETPSIKIKKTVVEKLSLQQNDCPVPPCTTPLGTPPGQTPPQSPNAQRIQRSNSACIGNVELLPCRYNSKLFNKRRNTQLLQSNMISDQQESSNSLPASQVFYGHRLQSLRTLAAGAQKSSSLVSKGLLNRGLSKELKEGKDIDDDEMETMELKESKELNKLNIKEDAVDNKLSENFSKKVKLAESSNGDLLNGAALSQTATQQPPGNLPANRTGSSKKHSTVKENERNIVRTFRTSQELDELIKDNKRNPNIDNDVQKIIATAEMRKNQLMLLLDEHAKIVNEIKMAETTK